VRFPTRLKPGPRIRLERPFPASCNRQAEQDPARVGLWTGAAERIWSRVEDLYATALYPAIALCMRVDGQVLLDRSIGDAVGNLPSDPKHGPRVRATPDTPYCMFSASKAVTAMLVHMLDDRGLLHIADRVVEYIPEFGRHGKERVTIRHLLSHRAGIPMVQMDSEDLSILDDRQEIVDRFCDARLDSPPGRRLSYHALTGGFVLGEIVHRVTGRDINSVLQSAVVDPLDLGTFGYGIEPERSHEVALGAFTGLRPFFPASVIADRALGMSFPMAARLANEKQFLESIVPSGNIIGTPDAICRFFELLRCGGELDGIRVFEPRTVRRAANETAYMEVDFTLGLPIRYGIGFMLGSRWISPFGPDSEEAFGHLGLMNIHCWADPSRRLSVALITTGRPLISDHLLPLWRVLSSINHHVPKRGPAQGRLG
jgi:CubicO group peptidase (beta-lactamase class C family)